MAYFARDKAGRVFVFYWDPHKKQKCKLPREKTRYLDALPDDDVRVWADRWQHQHGPKIVHALATHLTENDEAQTLFEGFLESYQATKGTSQTTMEDERGRFYKHIVPVIVGEMQKKDVRTWETCFDSLRKRLQFKKKLANAQINKCFGLLIRFSQYLKRKGILSAVWDIPYIFVPKASTPLIAPVSPEQALDFARKQTDVRVKLICLLSYFASLRPEEIFALAWDDFVIGSEAVEKSPTYERFQKHNFGSKITIHLQRRMNRQSNIDESTKKENLQRQRRSAVMQKAADIESTGEYVTVWHSEAAIELAKTLNELPKGPLFSVKRKRLFEIWCIASENVLNVTIKDMRRASGYFLGRVKDIAPQLLQDHMRHEDFETTLLYMRRPKVENPKPKDRVINLADVV